MCGCGKLRWITNDASSVGRSPLSNTPCQHTQALLREDDNLLRQTFFTILRHHHPELTTKVDVIYALAQAWCYSESESDFEMLDKRLTDLKPDEAILVSYCLRLYLLLQSFAHAMYSKRLVTGAGLQSG